jgi:hypothetical protein
MPVPERAVVREVTRFQPSRIGGKDGGGNTKIRGRGRGEKTNKRVRKKVKTFLDSILSRIKSFAKVSLSSKHRSSKEYKPSVKLTTPVQTGFKSGTMPPNSPLYHVSIQNFKEDNTALEQKVAGGNVLKVDKNAPDNQKNHKSIMNMERKSHSTKEASGGKNDCNNTVLGIEKTNSGENIAPIGSRSRSKEARGRSMWGMEKGVEVERGDEDRLSQERIVSENQSEIAKVLQQGKPHHEKNHKF